MPPVRRRPILLDGHPLYYTLLLGDGRELRLSKAHVAVIVERPGDRIVLETRAGYLIEATRHKLAMRKAG